MKRCLSILSGLTVGLVGGLVSHALVRSAYAAYEAVTPLRELRCVDAQQRLYADLTQSDRGSALTFYDPQGHARLRLGIHPDGSPFLGLYTGADSEHARALFRLAGPQQAASLILKDGQNRDRLVMGIHPTDEQDPFFVYYDKDGTSHTLFGHS